MNKNHITESSPTRNKAYRAFTTSPPTSATKSMAETIFDLAGIPEVTCRAGTATVTGWSRTHDGCGITLNDPYIYGNNDSSNNWSWAIDLIPGATVTTAGGRLLVPLTDIASVGTRRIEPIVGRFE